MFCPSMLHRRTVTPAVPNGATEFYVARSYTMAPTATAREEVDGNSFAHASVPVKFVPYNNVAFGHGGNDTPYVQPVSVSLRIFLCFPLYPTLRHFNSTKHQLVAIVRPVALKVVHILLRHV